MAIVDQREKIVQIVKMRGPLLPSQINKELNTNVLFASAMLSELVDAKRIRLSRLKIGGSPLYYIEGQEHKLQEYSHKLHEKEQKAFERLRMQKILKESEQEPVVRAALREIKDFAKPLEVSAKGITEIFWKWYLLPQEEAERIIKEKLEAAEQNAKQKFTEQKQAEQQFVPPAQTLPQQTTQQSVQLQQPAQQLLEQPRLQPKQEEKSILKGETYPVHPENYFSTVRANLFHEKEQKQEKSETLSAEMPKKHKETQKIAQKPVQRQLKKEDKKENEKKEMPKAQEQEITEIDDDFLKIILQYFTRNSIKITSYSIIRKNSEIDFKVTVPSNIGSLSFFCKARKKSKCNEGDLSKLFLDGQKMKMPVLFLTTGDLTKKAAAMLNEEFKNITVKKL